MDVLAFCFVIGLHFYLIVDMNYVNVLYLGGDTTRVTNQANKFLQTGVCYPDLNDTFESGFFCLSFIPFLILFKNTILAIQIANIFFGILTVTVLFLFIRRTTGLISALCIGAIYATSPMLLGHCMPEPLFLIPLWLGIILLLETFKGQTVKYVSVFTAGIFTGFTCYFIFPYFGYVLGLILHKNLIRHITFKKIGLFIFLYILGFLLCYFHNFMPKAGSLHNLLLFVNLLFEANIERLRHVLELISNFWVQLTWSLDSNLSYGASNNPALYTLLVYFWILCMFISVFFKDSRRWAITLAIGFIPACLLSSISSDTGIGMRHFLSFLPFYWLMLASLISRVPWRRGKYIICIVAVIIATRYFNLNRQFIENPDNISFADKILRDAQYMKSYFSLCSRNTIVVDSNDDNNLCLGLQYFIPDKNIVSIPTKKKKNEPGFIYLCKESKFTHKHAPNGLLNKKYYNLGSVDAIGGWGYAVNYEL